MAKTSGWAWEGKEKIQKSLDSAHAREIKEALETPAEEIKS